MFTCENWLFDWYFLNFAHLICRSTDISKCLRGSLRLRDNKSRLYLQNTHMLVIRYDLVSQDMIFTLSTFERGNLYPNLG